MTSAMTRSATSPTRVESCATCRNPPRNRQGARAVYADHVDSVSAELAFHYESAGASDKAIWWYSRAADAATGVYANAECIRLLRRALDLLATAPPGATRALRELELRPRCWHHSAHTRDTPGPRSPRSTIGRCR